jgi:two-component system alkaline phosphatase synthesis response regulator PhoP
VPDCCGRRPEVVRISFGVTSSIPNKISIPFPASVAYDEAMGKKHIFIVEDEPDIAELLTYNLTREGYEVSVATRGDQALTEIPRKKTSLVLLDLMLPGVGGLEICRLLKAKPETAGIPVVMVTARGEESDVVIGLEMGADDYIVKPFSIKVVLARIHAVLRRREKIPVGTEEVLKVHDLTINPGRHEVLCGKTAVELTASEFRLLHFLARRPGWVFTREQIVDGVKGEDYAVTDRAVDVQVVSLRRKLGKRGDYIETVRGVGYRFKE